MDTFDEEKYNIITADIIRNIKKQDIQNEDLDQASMKLKKKIDRKPYSIGELNNMINDLQTNMTKLSFDKQDIVNVANQLKINKKEMIMSLNPLNNFQGLSITESIKVIVKLILRTIMNIADDFIVLFVSIMIVLNLQFRANTPSSLLYPSNPNTFPYVFFEPNNTSSQSHLTSCIETNTKDSDDDVFLDSPAFFTSQGKYSLDKNICKINDPHGSSDSAIKANCDKKGDEEFTKPFTQNINYENLDFFAKQFMQNNTSKNTNELSIYSLFTYIMLYTTIYTNGSMGSINNFFSLLFKTPKNKSMVHLILFFVLTLIFYNLFQSSKYTFSNFIEKIFLKNKDYSFLKQNDIFTKLIEAISGFFSPFMMFFKLLLLIIYPLVLFHSVYGYIHYSTLAAGIITKLFCYFGVAFSLSTFLGYILLLSKVVLNKRKSLDEVFEDLIQSFLSMVEKSLVQLISAQDGIKNMKFSYEARSGKGKGSQEGFKGKGSKKKGKGNEDEDGEDGGGGIGGGGIGGGGGAFSGFSCSMNDLFQFTFLKNLIRSFGFLIFMPIVILLFMIPASVSLYMAFSQTKSITLDYLKYLNKLVCHMGSYKMIIRLLFYFVTVMEIMKYMNKPFRFFTIGVLLALIFSDFRRDFIKENMILNKCKAEDNAVNDTANNVANDAANDAANNAANAETKNE